MKRVILKAANKDKTQVNSNLERVCINSRRDKKAYHDAPSATCNIVQLPNSCTCIHVIVVSWFLQCMGYVPREGCMYFRGWSPRKYIQYEGGTYPMHCKNQETAVLYNRPRKATTRR